MPTFGENLRELRKSRGYSQDRFAKIIGTNQVNVSAWELGTRKPTFATIKHIAETFNVPLSSLISITDTGTNDDYLQEIAELLQRRPSVRLLFDRAKYMSEDDMSAVLSIVNAITRERRSDD